MTIMTSIRRRAATAALMAASVLAANILSLSAVRPAHAMIASKQSVADSDGGDKGITIIIGKPIIKKDKKK